MKAKKPDNRIAQMAVLKDIRGLLSTASAPSLPAADAPAPAPAPRTRKEDLEKRLADCEKLVRQQQDAISKLEAEKKDLEARLNALQQAPARPATPDDGLLSRDVADLSARKEELSSALARIEDLLHLKINDLTRRIARVYQEAGDMDAGRDFRHISNQLEAAGAFGEFLRSLLGE